MNHTSPIVGALLGSLLASVAHAQQPASAPSEDGPAAPPPSLVALARGAALDPSPWRWSSPLTWPARPSQAAARVVLPESIWSRANADLSDLRIVTGDAPPQQLAFVLNQDAEATALLTRDAARPTPQPEHPGWSVIELPLEHTHIPGLTVRVTTTQCPFSRTVEIVTRRAPSNRAAATRQWGCTTGAPTPLRFSDLRADGARLLLRFKDGDNAPLEPLTVEVLHRRRAALLPAAPLKAQPRLLVGNPHADAPTYDLELVRDDLLRLPAEEIAVGVWIERLPEEEPIDWRHRVTPALIAAAALAMLLLLLMTLRRVDPDEEPPAEEEP